MISVSSVVLALAVASPALADLGKTSLFTNGLHDPLIALDDLPFQTFTYSGVTVPDLCISHATDSGCDTSTVEAYQANYGDCSEPWTLCRCADAQMRYAVSHVFTNAPPDHS